MSIVARALRRRLAVAAVAVCASAASLVGLPASIASAAASCAVTNVTQAQVYVSLQSAEDAALDGERLEVRGTCVGSTLVDTDLLIVGVKSTATGVPTLSGGRSVRPLIVAAGTKLTIQSLTVRNGRADGGSYPDDAGGGILNGGTLVLKGVIVQGNVATNAGGGIANLEGARLKLARASSVHHNHAVTGGGIESRGTLTLTDTTVIHHNTASAAGGGLSVDGVAYLRLSSRVEINASRVGGGIRIGSDGDVRVHDAALVRDNLATDGPGSGGGISDDGGSQSGAACGVNVIANTPDQIAPSCPA